MDNATRSKEPNFHKLLIIDIETVPIVADYNALPTAYQHQWYEKIKRQLNDPEDLTELPNIFNDKAGIYAEFGKIICIGIGMFEHNKHESIRLKAIANDDETIVLREFFEILEKMGHAAQIKFCGHNIKEFDLAYICRRAMIHQIPLPSCLQLSMMKPWQNPHLDTLELWRFGDYKHYITLDLLAFCLQVPTSKGDISGKDVAKVYYEQKDLKRISTYCLQDVYTTALVYLRLQQIPYTEVIPTFVD